MTPPQHPEIKRAKTKAGKDIPLDMDRYAPHGTILDADLLRAIRGKQVGVILGMPVYATEGEIIRGHVDIDHVAGGNPGRYSYNPERELWVEKTMVPTDFSAVLLHELVEMLLMVDQSIDYDRAHEFASSVEVPYRQAISAGKVKIHSYPNAVRAAERWFHEHVVEGGVTPIREVHERYEIGQRRMKP